MGDSAKQSHISLGLLAHVSASRREPHLNSFIPGPKTGDFSYSAEVKHFQGIKIPPYFVVSLLQKPQHMVVDFRNSALQPFFRSENEVGFDKTFAVGYKGEICTADYLILL